MSREEEDERRVFNALRMCQDKTLFNFTSRLANDRDEWKRQHENLLAVKAQDNAALTAEIERLRARIAEWQPIETAPKDGRTLLLGYFNSLGKWRTLRGQWMSEDYIYENWEEPENGVPGWHETSVEADDAPNCWFTTPTHWMPLPKQPGEQS